MAALVPELDAVPPERVPNDDSRTAILACKIVQRCARLVFGSQGFGLATLEPVVLPAEPGVNACFTEQPGNPVVPGFDLTGDLLDA